MISGLMDFFVKFDGEDMRSKWDLCEYVIVHTILPPSPVILWIELGGKPKWLPLNFGYHDVMCTAPIRMGRQSTYYG